MGVFSELDMERSYPQEDIPAGFSFEDDSAEDEIPFSQQTEAPCETASGRDEQPEPDAGDMASDAGGDTDKAEDTEVPAAKAGAAADDDAKRKAHEEAEAKRKAEFDAKQQARREKEAAELARVAAMSDGEVTAASMQRIGADTEKLTRRNMKECVAEYIQTRCIEDPAFARLTMHPLKSMIHCFWYINRKAREFVEQEMKDNDIKRESVNGVYGSDVPDDLCYQWAEDYFRDPDAEEDHRDEEKFVPKPYVGKSTSAKAKKAKEPKKKDAPKPKPKPEGDNMQLSLLEAAS